MALIARDLVQKSEFQRTVFVRTLQSRDQIAFLPQNATLVFDLQVFSMFNTLSRLLYWGGHSNASVAYFSKILAEEGLVLRSPLLVECGYEMFVTMSQFWKPRPSQTFPKSVGYMSFHYLFVFAHEYCHLALKQGGSLQVDLENIGLLGAQSELAMDWQEQLRNRYSLEWSQASNLEAHISRVQEIEDFANSHVELLRSEMACDTMALTVLLRACEVSSISATEAIKAAWLSLRHVRVRSVICALARELHSGLPITGMNDKVRLMDVRIYRMYSRIELLLDSIGIEKPEVVTGELHDLSASYDLFIDQVVMSDFISHVIGLMYTKTQSFPNARSFSYSLDQAESFGWLPRSKTMPHVVL